MFGSHRNIVATVAGLAILATSLFFLIRDLSTVDSSYRHAAADAAVDYQGDASAYIEKRCFTSAGLREEDCAAKAHEAARESQRKEQDLAAQNITAWWTKVMGIAALIGMAFSAVGVWLVKTTFDETRKANVIAQTALDLEGRPFVIPDGQIAHSMPEGIGKIWVEFAYINIGKAPAFTIESSVTRDSEFGPYADTKEASPTILFDKVRYIHSGRSFVPNTRADVELLIKYRSVMNGKIYTTAAKGVIFPTHHAEKTEVNCVRWDSIVCEEQKQAE